MTRNDYLIAGAVAVVLLATAALAPMVAQSRPAFEIPVYDAPADEPLSNVSGEGWDRAPPVTIPLSSAGAAVPNADDTTVEEVNVQAARTNERLYLRLSWADATRDSSTASVRSFADAVAVQLPANATARPPITMGGTNNPVNVWYWSGANATEELIAGGPGSTTSFDRTTVETDVSYDDGRWHVAFSRSLGPASDNRTAIPRNADMDIAVAAWNGSNMERSGQKAVSEWYYLALGPGPEGPPYQTILWIVAGIAIVITTLVTLEGVRRSGGE